MKVNLLSKKILPLVILGVLVLISFIAIKNPPESNRKPPSNDARMSVKTITINESSFQVQLQSYGTIQPRTRSQIVAQVSGQVVWVSPQFRDGGVFKAGETLLRIDDRDYEADVKIAEAALLNAQQMLAQEQAARKVAIDGWEKLELEETPSDLTLRKPQLMAAEAQVASAEAGLSKAKLNLERTSIAALYDGRILNQLTDIGQVVGNNAPLADIYANDYVEIRLPLRNKDLAFIDLPGDGIDDSLSPAKNYSASVQSNIGNKYEWNAKLVRTESSIDENSQQLHVIAQIDKPFDSLEQNVRPLKIGEYVTAKISGKQVDNAIVIPNKTIYQGSYVYIVEEGVLMRRNINITWQDDKVALIDQGLEAGEELVTTPMGQVGSGTRVKIIKSAESSTNIASPTSSIQTETQNKTTAKNLSEISSEPANRDNRS